MKKFNEIEKAIVFGSRAIGNYKKGSDVDIAIIGDGIDSKTVYKLDDYLNEVYGMNFKPDTVVDEVRKYRGNCDGLDKEHGVLLECKTFSGKLKVDYYTPQCQFYMELFNIDECWLVGYDRPKDFYHGIDYALENDHTYFNSDFDEKRLVIYKITRDKDMFREIEVEIDKFKYLLKCLKEEEEINARRNRQ